VIDLVVAGERVAVGDADLIGVGGEGRVYRWNGRAVKVFHDAAAGLPARERARKVKKVRAFPAGLPAAVVGPIDPVSDARGETVGFTMRLVEGAVDAMRLGQRRWREGVVSNGEVIAIFRKLRATLGELHARGVVVGDLNDGNVLFRGDTPWLIDADSMQYAGFPCVVAHERFLDPRLFGLDLTKGGAFTAGSDWFAFAVMLFASLLYVHPYGGSHPKLPTMLRRAEARHSVLRSDVKYPRAAAHFGALPDALCDWFGAVFDGDARAPIPEALLDVRWTRCACGVEHARTRCPGCSVIQAARLPATAGRFRVTTILETRGRVLHVAMQGGLLYAYEEDGIIHRESGARIAPSPPLDPTARVALDGGVTWIGRGDRIAAFDEGGLREQRTVSTFFGEAAFDASVAGCVHADGAFLVSADKRLGPILEGQTWVRVGARFGIGFYRVGRRAFVFVFTPARGGFRTCEAPAVDGKLVDIAATFGDDRVLLATAAEKDGRRTITLSLYDDAGILLASASGSPEDRPILGSLTGKCLAFGSMLCATDDGLLLVRVDPSGRRFVEDKLFAETRDFVSAGAELVPGPGGSVYVASERAIVHVAIH
jgi:hypothetical protein